MREILLNDQHFNIKNEAAVGVLLLRKLALETVSRVGRMTAKSANRCPKNHELRQIDQKVKLSTFPHGLRAP